jgi:hypothetical protein
MKLTKETLKRIIKEELDNVINEYRIAPDLQDIPDEFKIKIDSLIDAGELNQAQSLVDALGGPPNYVDDYVEYQEVGNIEKLGTAANRDGMSRVDFYRNYHNPALHLAGEKIDKYHPHNTGTLEQAELRDQFFNNRFYEPYSMETAKKYRKEFEHLSPEEIVRHPTARHYFPELTKK